MVIQKFLAFLELQKFLGLQFRVAEISNFSKAFSSVQFSSVHFYLAKIQYNARIHIGIVRLQGSPEETRRLYEAWAPQSKRDK